MSLGDGADDGIIEGAAVVTGPHQLDGGAQRRHLRRLAALLDDGTLRVHVHDTFELERVRSKLAIGVR